MNLLEFLTWASTAAGAQAIVGFAESFAIEWIPGFSNLSKGGKRLAAMGLSFVIPVGSVLIQWALGAMPITVDSVWAALSAGFSAFFGSQVSHIRQLKPKIHNR